MTELLIDRKALIGAIMAFLSNRDAATLAEIRDALGRTIDAAGEGALVGLNEQLARAGSDWDYYARDPLARTIHHLLADRILPPDSVMHGIENLMPIIGKPVVLFVNHLSYADANLVEVLFYRAGGDSLSDRLTVVAGPKVYSSLKRRFSSLCFSTIKTPQSSALSSEDAVMNAREVARAARQSIDAAKARLRAGDTLLVFAEGTRSRTKGLQPMLTGVTRYLEQPDTWVVPVGITGTEDLFPIGDDKLHSVRCVARVGKPIEAKALRELTDGNRRITMDTVGLAIADLLPPDYRGAYANHANDLAAAKNVLGELLPT